MRTIWKFPLPLLGDWVVSMPRYSRILAVQTQANVPMLWAEVDDLQPSVDRHFEIHGTGHHLPGDPHARTYLGTIQTDGGQFVWHIYELEEGRTP